ncbi:MAG: ATP-binding protein [Goleter apudmare HA4340-LM2]|jgi:hypothetical protein|nr:ATP-binding protein [Goleter apudmare HA4340-LM2]
MARSLRVAPEYIKKVRLALPIKGYATQESLAVSAGLALSTVKNFLSGKPVSYGNFVELSSKLGLDWQEIAHQEPDKQQHPYIITQERSPFITGPPIIHPRYFFGREKELKRLFDLLKRHPLQNAAILGKKRSGKTSLLHYLKNITRTPTVQLRSGQKLDWLPHPSNYQWIFVDFQDPRLGKQQRLLRHILGGLGIAVPTPCDLDNFMDVVSHNLRSPTVILLDEIGAGLQRCLELDDRFWDSLRSLATNYTGGNLAFILASPESPIQLARNTGHSSPFFNIFGYTTTLGALTEAEARELIANSPMLFPPEDVEWILTQSRCFPLLVQILCRERLFSLEDGQIGDSWRQEALQQIQSFTHLL